MSSLEPLRWLGARQKPPSGDQLPLRGTLAFVLKVVSRCNLNCSYCYVYNKGDSTWRTRPVLMIGAKRVSA